MLTTALTIALLIALLAAAALGSAAFLSRRSNARLQAEVTASNTRLTAIREQLDDAGRRYEQVIGLLEPDARTTAGTTVVETGRSVLRPGGRSAQLLDGGSGGPLDRLTDTQFFWLPTPTPERPYQGVVALQHDGETVGNAVVDRAVSAAIATREATIGADGTAGLAAAVLAGLAERYFKPAFDLAAPFWVTEAFADFGYLFEWLEGAQDGWADLALGRPTEAVLKSFGLSSPDHVLLGRLEGRDAVRILRVTGVVVGVSFENPVLADAAVTSSLHADLRETVAKAVIDSSSRSHPGSGQSVATCTSAPLCGGRQ